MGKLTKTNDNSVSMSPHSQVYKIREKKETEEKCGWGMGRGVKEIKRKHCRKYLVGKTNENSELQ